MQDIDIAKIQQKEREEAAKALAAQEFGKKVAQIRKTRRMSQQELGESIGMHQSVISEIERGVYILTLDIVGRLAKALRINPTELAAVYWGIDTTTLSDKDRKFIEAITSLVDEYTEDGTSNITNWQPDHSAQVGMNLGSEIARKRAEENKKTREPSNHEATPENNQINESHH